MRDYSRIPPLARGGIDRDAATRMDDAALERAWAEPGARLLELRGTTLPLQDGALALLPIAGPRSTAHWYLGRFAGAPIFATDVDGTDGTDGTGGSGGTGDSAGTGGTADRDATTREWVPARAAGVALSPDEAELVAMAVALQHWHASAAFSPRDGSETQTAQGGWARVEPATGVEHFPRTDPAVIVLVVHENRALLGSNVLWEAGRFSLLAGFVEAGESAEQAARREVAEESGVRIDRLDYLGSQPWPFPRSLMLGYLAGLAAGQDPAALSPDPTEIAELRWFSRDELRSPADGLKLPREGSIARWIIDSWIAQGDDAEVGRAGGAERGV